MQKHDTYSEACCFCLSLLPFTYQPPLPLPAGTGVSPLLSPHKSLQREGLPKKSSSALVICRIMTYFLPEETESLQSTGRLHPPHPTSNDAHTVPLGTLQGAHPAHQDHKDQGLRREGSFSSTCHQGRIQYLPPTPIASVEQEQSVPTLDHFPNSQTRQESQTPVAKGPDPISR